MGSKILLSHELFYFFFFKQKTAYEIKECDWSSDVCSSDLWIKMDEYNPDGNTGAVVMGNYGGNGQGTIFYVRDRKSVV